MTNKNKLICMVFIALLALIILSSHAYALGIFPGENEIKVKEDVSLKYRIINNEKKDMKVKIYALGDIEGYVNISEKEIAVGKNESFRDFEVRIDKEKIRPGRTEGKIAVEEAPVLIEQGFGISARLRVLSRLAFEAVYDKYIDVRIDVEKKNETLDINARLRNTGEKNISEIKSDFGIYDGERKLYDIGMAKQSLVFGEEKEIKAQITSLNLRPGVYSIIADFWLDDYATQVIKDFRIGEMNLSVYDYTRYFLEESPNKFQIQTINNWNQKISGVYAEVAISRNGTAVAGAKSQTYDINAYEKKMITGYWDVKGISIGDYDMDINISYAGKITSFRGKIKVLSEKEYAKLSKRAPWIFIILAIIILIAIANIIVWKFIIRRKEKRYSSKHYFIHKKR